VENYCWWRWRAFSSCYWTEYFGFSGTIFKKTHI